MVAGEVVGVEVFAWDGLVALAEAALVDRLVDQRAGSRNTGVRQVRARHGFWGLVRKMIGSG